MSPPAPKINAPRIVVVTPNWLGDAVMATPFLRALREVYGREDIVAVARGPVADVCKGLVGEVKVYAKGEEAAVSRWMRSRCFLLGILLPNSFRSAWMLWRGNVRRRIGYARGGRGLLLTDRIQPTRRTAATHAADNGRAAAIRGLGGGRVSIGSEYEPVAAITYYLEICRRVLISEILSPSGRVQLSDEAGRREKMELAVNGDEVSEAERALRELGAPEGYVVLVPGANFGASKCWLPERFAAVAERLVDPAGDYRVQVILAGSPAEMAICDAIIAAVPAGLRERVHVLGRVNGGKGVSIGVLKEIVRRSRLMLCNDTGPRHIAAAFEVPTVTLFGPTDPVWAKTFFEKERIVRVDVACGPCQLKVCPIDHRCMKGITVEMVMEAVHELWDGK